MEKEKLIQFFKQYVLGISSVGKVIPDTVFMVDDDMEIPEAKFIFKPNIFRRDSKRYSSLEGYQIGNRFQNI